MSTAGHLVAVWDALADDVPARDAVVAGARRVPHAELAGHGRGFGGWLREQGIGNGDAVVLVLGGPELFETLAGTLAAGAVPVTVDPGVSGDELHRVVDVTDARVVVHGPDEARHVRLACKRIQRRWRPVTLETGEAYDRVVVPPATRAVEDRVPAASVVLVATAPGSSAMPSRLDTDALAQAARLQPGDPRMVLAPPAHAVALVACLEAITAGGTLVLPASSRWTGTDVLDAVTREHVREIVLDGDRDAARMRAALLTPSDGWDLSSLRVIVSGDTPMSAEVRDDLAHALPGVMVRNAGRGPAGGERDADAPAARDVIRTMVGPVDPTLVEACYVRHRSVTACRVVGLADRNGGEVVVALVVVAEQHYLDGAELAAWSRRKLEAHEIPRAWVFVDAIDPAATDDELRVTALDRLRPH